MSPGAADRSRDSSMRVPRTRPLNPRACVKTGARGGGLQAQGCETVSGGLSARDVNCFSSFAESPFAWNSGRDAPTSLWKGGVAGTHPLCPGEDYFISGLPEAALGLLESLGLDPGPAAGTGGKGQAYPQSLEKAWSPLLRSRETGWGPSPSVPPPLGGGGGGGASSQSGVSFCLQHLLCPTSLLGGALAAAPSRMRHQENHIRARVQAWQPGAHPTGAPHLSGAHAAGTQRTWGRRVPPHPFTALLALPLVLQVSMAPLWARAWCPPRPTGPTTCPAGCHHLHTPGR